MAKWLAWLSAICLAGSVMAADDRALRTVIVFNEDEPESRPLAEYYAERRGVPTNQICAIRVRPVETITRQEYIERIRKPLERFLGRAALLIQEPVTFSDPEIGTVPWFQTTRNRTWAIVLMYGVPLRIDRDPNLKEKFPPTLPEPARRNEASVESELALLPSVGVVAVGPQPNPFYNDASAWFSDRYSRAMVLVGRLDGPDPATVRRMIDDALAVERYGLHGRAYFDIQSTTDKGYTMGDDWIRDAYRAFTDAGYECELDVRPATYGTNDVVTDVAVYAGWYAQNVTGPFQRAGFRFRQGALAYHLHSASGASVRTRDTYWVGPLLARGAAATMGNVFEPYLTMTPHVDIWSKRLLEGATFLEAGYASEPALSWQTTFVGDPLYRPFATSLDDQIARLEAEKRPEIEWAYLRQVNLLYAATKRREAETLCREKARALNSPVLFEKLGDLLRGAQRNDEALAIYEKLVADFPQSERAGEYSRKALAAGLAAGKKD